MKRRKAIGTILLAGGAAALGVGGYEWYSLAKHPDRDYLLSRKMLLAELAETIIPATDTPGAKEAGAAEYMLQILDKCTDKKTLNRFISGLKDLEDYTQSIFHCDYATCMPTEKEEVLSHFEKQAKATGSLYYRAKDKYTGKPFFETLKTYAVYGYCISEKGATIGMQYLAVPGKYLACIPLQPNQKAWATK